MVGHPLTGSVESVDLTVAETSAMGDPSTQVRKPSLMQLLVGDSHMSLLGQLPNSSSWRAAPNSHVIGIEATQECHPSNWGRRLV